jgi:hypothetical protein
MILRDLVSPMDEEQPDSGPIENSFYSSYQLTKEQIRDYEGMALLTQAPLTRCDDSQETPISKLNNS